MVGTEADAGPGGGWGAWVKVTKRWYTKHRYAHERFTTPRSATATGKKSGSPVGGGTTAHATSTTAMRIYDTAKKPL